jgi:Raf kinase inhibitor-like YbhB/YbcL family protein
MNGKRSLVFVIVSGLLFLFSVHDLFSEQKKGGRHMELTITSSAFSQGGEIPSKHTCDGADISPPLSWKGAPSNAKSFALICDDPDAPMGTWVHWVVYNIPASMFELGENITSPGLSANGALEGMNDFRKTSWGGPCPPGGVHRYFFKLYALDVMLDLNRGSNKAQLMSAMKGHVLAEGQLMGRYSRKK